MAVTPSVQWISTAVALRKLAAKLRELQCAHACIRHRMPISLHPSTQNVAHVDDVAGRRWFDFAVEIHKQL